MDAKTVYLVEDDPMMLRTVQAILVDAGYEVVTFDRGDTFLEQWQPARAGCIVMDLVLPGTDGLELIKALNDLQSVVPIIMLTGFGSVAKAVQAMRSGAFDFLEKPVENKRLLSSVRHAMDVQQGRQERQAELAQIRSREQTLSPRESEVTELIVSGLSNHQIGKTLHISEKTVASHRLEIMRKMEASNAADLARMITLARYA
jgi:FixJ family two-component response regulator